MRWQVLVIPSSAVDLAHKGGEDAEALHMLHSVAASWGLGGFSLKVHRGTAGGGDSAGRVYRWDRGHSAGGKTVAVCD